MPGSHIRSILFDRFLKCSIVYYPYYKQNRTDENNPLHPKLLKGMENPPLVDIRADTEGLGNWYANIIRIDRKKCLLFTNEKTLYSFVIPNVRKANPRNIVDEFLVNLSFNLQAEGFGL